jgi:AraC-like DNA-binding protein
MDIQNVEEHLSCHCYEGGENPLIEVRKIKRMETGETLLSCNEIIFVLSGKIRINMLYNQNGELNKGQFVFLPSGYNAFYKAINKSQIIIFRLDESIRLCYTYSLEHLYNRVKNDDKPENFSMLDSNVRMWHFINALVDTWEDGLRCRLYLQVKVSELLLLMRVYYSEEQLGQFFYFILRSDTAFAEFVRISYLQYPTVIKLAKAMNMTPQQFTKRFINVFGQAPYGWMLREKARLIYGELCQSDKPIQEIAAQFGFPIPANFTRFCKAAFGMSPGEIRKKRS